MAESKRGRPPLVPGDTTTPVSVRVPTREYDRACERASRNGINVRELLRRGLSRVLDDDDDDGE
jgi:hypothetical protein